MKLQMKASVVFNRIIRGMALIGGILLILQMIGVNVEIVLRYFFGRPIFWIDEVGSYALLYITFLCAAWLLMDDAHVKVDLVLIRLKPGPKALLNAITSILGAINCLIITWYSFQVTWDYYSLDYRINSLLAPQAFLIMAIIPVGSFTLFVQFLRRAFGYIKSWKAI